MANRKKYGGSAYDQQFFTDDELRRAAAIRSAAAAGDTSWKDAHDYVEGIRENYGYSGGNNGSGYNRTRQSPTYTSPYQSQIDALYEQISNRPAFSYDYTQDPRWQSYHKQYAREGQRAAADALGQAAALTGGMPSTAAITASQQAGNYYAAQAADKIPALYQAAYDMYQTDGDRMMQQLNALRGLEGDAYGRYQDALGQYNLDRNYNQALEDTAYNRQRDAIEDQRYADELNYNRQLALAQLGQGVGDYSGLNALGITPNWNNVASATTAGSASLLKGSGGGGGGGSRNSSKSSGSGGTVKAKDDPMGYLEQFGADSYEDAVAALRLQGVNKDSAEYYAKKYMDGGNKEALPSKFGDFKRTISGLLSTGQDARAMELAERYSLTDSQYKELMELFTANGYR